MAGEHPHQTQMAGEGSEAPLVTFGTFGDVQHSCKRNGVKVRGPRVRNRYSETALELLCQAVTDWKRGPMPVTFLLNLGNLTELHDEPGYDRDQSLMHVLDSLENFPRPKYHVIGHHDLKQFTRREFRNSKLHSAVNSPGAVPASHDKFFYHFAPSHGVRVVVIDTLEISLVGYDDCLSAMEYKRAVSLVRANNPNPNCREIEGLTWQDSKYTCINGAATNIQLQWLVEVLDYSDKNGEVVLVAGHNPLCATDRQRYSFVPWNNDEILGVLHKFPCVVAYFSSHDLDGGYMQDDHGIHHITMPGIVETPPCSNAHATVHVFRDRLEVSGVGRCPSMSLFYQGRGRFNGGRPQPVAQQPKPLALSPVAPPQVVVPVQKAMPMGNFGMVNAQGGCGPAQVMPNQLPPGKGRPPPFIMAQMEREAAAHPMAHGAMFQQPAPQPMAQGAMFQQAAPPAGFGQQGLQVMNDPGLGNIKRAIPVTIAVPMEKLRAMGGMQNFQIAAPPKDMGSAIDIAGNKVWNLNEAQAAGQGKGVTFNVEPGQAPILI